MNPISTKRLWYGVLSSVYVRGTLKLEVLSWTHKGSVKKAKKYLCDFSD